MKIFTLTTLLVFACIFPSDILYSQTNNWTWVKGDNIGTTPPFNTLAPIYGIKGVASNTNSPGQREEAVTWTDNSGNLWLFGGYTDYGSWENYNDLWKYNIAANQWTWVSGDSTPNAAGVFGTMGVAAASNKPAARAKAVGWTDLSGNLWLWGGADSILSHASFNDLWKYNTATNEWTWMHGDSLSGQRSTYNTLGVPNATCRPGVRMSAFTCTDTAGNLWLFGGIGRITSGIGELNELWKYNPSTNQWTQMRGSQSQIWIPGNYGSKGIPSPSTMPGSRYSGVAWIDNSNNIWVFGGYGRGHHPDTYVYGKLNDLWKYNITTNQWTWMKGDSSVNAGYIYGIKGVADAANKPGSREGGMGWKDNAGDIWLFAGRSSFNGSYYNDLWKYSVVANQWTWVKGDSTRGESAVYGTMGVPDIANKPGAREVASNWTDLAGNFWLFAGGGYSQYGDELWTFNPSTAFPVHLLTFAGKLRDKIVNLQWIVDNEQNFSHYEVERGTNSREFSRIGSVKSQGQSGKNGYTYDDHGIAQLSFVNSFFYRLKMIDKDGSFTYSNIVNIKLSNNNGFSIYPNPATSSVQLQFDKNIHGKSTVLVADISGKIVVKKEMDVDGNIIPLYTGKLPGGNYTVKVLAGGEETVQKLVIILSSTLGS